MPVCYVQDKISADNICQLLNLQFKQKHQRIKFWNEQIIHTPSMSNVIQIVNQINGYHYLSPKELHAEPNSSNHSMFTGTAYVTPKSAVKEPNQQNNRIRTKNSGAFSQNKKFTNANSAPKRQPSDKIKGKWHKGMNPFA